MALKNKRKEIRDLTATAEAVETADTTSTDQASLVETAEFKVLVELGDELFGEDGPDGKPGSNESDIADTDGLATPDKFKTLLEPDDDSDENLGFDPYNNTEGS